jgi:hypothetical protein
MYTGNPDGEAVQHELMPMICHAYGYRISIAVHFIKHLPCGERIPVAVPSDVLNKGIIEVVEDGESLTNVQVRKRMVTSKGARGGVPKEYSLPDAIA